MLGILFVAAIPCTAGFQWQVDIQDLVTQKSRHHTVDAEKQWDLGPFWCRVQPAATTVKDDYTTQSITITCEGEKVFASTGANCITSKDENGGRSQILTGEGRLSFAMQVKGQPAAAVLIETRCLVEPPKKAKGPRKK